jgi:hypothetical protein
MKKFLILSIVGFMAVASLAACKGGNNPVPVDGAQRK